MYTLHTEAAVKRFRWRSHAGILMALLLASSSLSGAIAHAQTLPSATTQPEYEIVLGQALDAHARGDYEAARIFMERAHALEPSARTLRGLGIVAFAQGKHLPAIRHLDAALASDVKPLSPELRASVSELLGQAWAQVGRYEVRLDPADGDFMVDGAAPDFYAPLTLALEPGAHLLTARAKARAPYEISLDVQPGTRETLHIVLAVPPAPEVIEKVAGPRVARSPSQTPQDADDGARMRPTWWTPTLRYAGIGTGAAFAIAGASLWLVGHAKLNEVAAACANTADGACTAKDARRRYDSKHIGTFAIASGALVGTGAALLATVGAIELWRWRSQERVVQAQVSATAIGLRGAF